MRKTLLLALLAIGCGNELVNPGGTFNNPSGNTASITTWKLDYPNVARKVVDELCGGPSPRAFQEGLQGEPDQGSTHELTWNEGQGGDKIWLTGQLYDQVVSVTLDGKATFHPMPEGSGPHGIEFNRQGQLWVSLEFAHRLAHLDEQGNLLESFEVNADPHGLGIAPDGVTAWFTGKTANTVGKLSPDGQVTNYPLPTPKALPIYIHAGPDGNMWFTELTGNKIGRITPSGQLSEFEIPTPNSRPIGIRPDPDGQAMWFTEEAGNKVARIDLQGNITEFPIPKPQDNVILASLSFDAEGILWVQQYVDQNNPQPPGDDHIIRIDRKSMQLTSYTVPDRGTVMHRITAGPDGNMWFTELQNDRIGRLIR